MSALRARKHIVYTFRIGAGHYDFDEDLFTAWLGDWSRLESAFDLLTRNADDLFHGRHDC